MYRRRTRRRCLNIQHGQWQLAAKGRVRSCVERRGHFGTLREGGIMMMHLLPRFYPWMFRHASRPLACPCRTAPENIVHGIGHIGYQTSRILVWWWWWGGRSRRSNAAHRFGSSCLALQIPPKKGRVRESMARPIEGCEPFISIVCFCSLVEP